jgi:hypothetical protein
MRGKYFTVKHPRLEACGHLLDMINFPKRNCHTCLFNWFNSHAQLVETAHQFYQQHGKGPLIAMRGEKFFKAFRMFMSTVAHFKKEAQEKNESNNQEESGTFVGGNDWNPTPEERDAANRNTGVSTTVQG